MMIVENFKTELTLGDLKTGDTFVILDKDFENPYMMTDLQYFIDLTNGELVYIDEEVYEKPVLKINFRLIQD